MLVIADDFTGAAEIAGIGHRYGLNARLVRGALWDVCADGLTVLDTDSRLFSPDKAASCIQNVLKSLIQKHVVFDRVFKKMDSVLRGPVLAEVEAALDVLGWKSALLVPQNPLRGRTVFRGCYSIDGVPLNLTTFARDPEYPCSTACVMDLLGKSQRFTLYSVAANASLSLREGIGVGDAMTFEDVRNWAARVKTGTLPVGGSDFFKALLEEEGLMTGQQQTNVFVNSGDVTLVVCGSASEMSREAVKRAQQEGYQVLPMPDAVFAEGQVASQPLMVWGSQIADALQSSGHAIIAMCQPVISDRTCAAHFAQKTAEVVAHVLSVAKVDRLLLEGGATASTVVGRMGWNDFVLQGEMAPGIVNLRTATQDATRLTIKPGSYSWPVNWKILLGKNNDE
jgi:uncharacterized protein YgbK (DUF1537 family)